MKTYIVQSGDTLGTIAQRFLGSSTKWNELWEANKDTVPNPNIIHVGQALKIPGTTSVQPVQTYDAPKAVVPTQISDPAAPNKVNPAPGNGIMSSIKNLTQNKTVMYAGIGLVGLLAVLFITRKKK